MKKIVFLILCITQTIYGGCFDCLFSWYKKEKSTVVDDDVLRGQLVITPDREPYISTWNDHNLLQLRRNTKRVCTSDNDLLVPIIVLCTIESDITQSWAASSGYQPLDDGLQHKQFVPFLPYAMLKKKRDGDHLRFTWNNKRIDLICSQHDTCYDSTSFHALITYYKKNYTWPSNPYGTS